MTSAANKTVLITGAGDDLVASVAADLEDTGVRRNRLHVFPDKQARRIHFITRFAPWLVPWLNRRMQAESIKVGKGAD